MTAPQRVDPTRIRRANRAQTVADTAVVTIWVSLLAVAAGLLAPNPALLWSGVIAIIPAVVVSIVASHLADRYRQPDDAEVS